MSSFKLGFRAVFLLLIATGILTGCVHKSIFSESPEKNLSLDNETIQREISRLEGIIAGDLQSELDSQVFLTLSLLHSNPNNEEPDYRRSQQMLDTFLSLQPDAAMAKDVHYLASLLMQINNLQDKQDALNAQYVQLKKDAQSLQGDSLLLKEENGQLVEQNKNLKNIIEQLKQLDLRLEEKRNAF